jgi:hypothetical protein
MTNTDARREYSSSGKGRETVARFARLVVLAPFAASALLPFFDHSAKADIGYCRGCGRLAFVNGSSLEFSTFASTTPDSVQAAIYTIHVPVGSRLARSWSGGLWKNKSTVSIVTDAPAGTYLVDTDVAADSTDGVATGISVNGSGFTFGYGQTNSTFSVQVTVP